MDYVLNHLLYPKKNQDNLLLNYINELLKEIDNMAFLKEYGIHLPEKDKITAIHP